MFKILLLLLLSTCVRNYVFGQSCSDCILITKCPAAIELLNKDTASVRDVLQNAQCGRFLGSLPQVCCSMLSTPAGDSDNIDTHANLRLLPDTCGINNKGRIFGGHVAGLYDYPWMALISYKTNRGPKFQCGGTLINDRYVLTAAHCVVGEQILGVRIGENDIRTKTDCQGQPPSVVCESNIQDIRVEKEIPHDQYTRIPLIKNDIALLRLQQRVNFEPKNAGAICLPVNSTMRNEYIDGGNGTVAGWGFTESGHTSPVLLAVGVPIYTKARCGEVYNSVTPNLYVTSLSWRVGAAAEEQMTTVYPWLDYAGLAGAPSGVDNTKSKICAGANGKDSCGGDSGGPLMVDDIYMGKSRLIQRGIVSYGPQACASDNPGVYTDVAPYMKWILDNIED